MTPISKFSPMQIVFKKLLTLAWFAILVSLQGQCSHSIVKLKQRSLLSAVKDTAPSSISWNSKISLFSLHKTTERTKENVGSLLHGLNHRRLQSENNENCGLDSSLIQDIYDRQNHQWNVSETFLHSLEDDLQQVISCTAPNDTILLNISNTIKPPGRILIPWNLTITGVTSGQALNDSTISESSLKTSFTCPDEDILFVVSKASAILSKFMVKDCSSSKDVIRWRSRCSRNQFNSLSLHHIYFRNITVKDEENILRIKGSCSYLAFDNVSFINNTCETSECVLLGSRNTLNDVRIANNRNNNESSLLQAFATVPAGSETTVRNMSGTENEIRLFAVLDSTIKLIDCYFEGNRQNFTSPIIAGGSVLLSNHSEVSVVRSEFLDNIANVAGGAMHLENAEASQISDSVFLNNTSEDHGGALNVNLTNNFTLVGSNFSENNARWRGGAVHLSGLANSEIFNLTFLNNAAEFGAAITLDDSSGCRLSGSSFWNNSARHSAAALRIWNCEHIEVTNTTCVNDFSDWGGSSVSSYNATDVNISNSRFTNSRVMYRGGALYITSARDWKLSNSVFVNSTAGTFGGALYWLSSERCQILNSEVSDSSVNEYGGGLFFDKINDFQIYNSTFRHNSAQFGGGALYISRSNRTTIENSKFERNRSGRGGACYLSTLSSSTFSNCTFRENYARFDGGSIYLISPSATTRDTVLTFDIARTLCFLPCPEGAANLTMDNCTMISNHAGGKGGGIAVLGNSSLVCQSCIFKRNAANSGGGLYVSSDNIRPIAAQLQNSVFENNTASVSGGGLDFFFPVIAAGNCSEPDTTCSRIILLNTSMVNNFANRSGAVVITTNLQGILVDCNYNDTQRGDYLSPDRIHDLNAVDPSNLCQSWIGNQATNKTSVEIIDLYVNEIILWTNSTTDTRIVGNLTSGFALVDLREGNQFPDIFFRVVDASGSSFEVIDPFFVNVTMASADDFLRGSYPATMVNGAGDFSRSKIISSEPPGNYSVNIEFNSPILETVILEVVIRNCQVGEELILEGQVCRICSEISYNFRPVETQCSVCPENGNCTGNYIVPDEGYWHKSPCHSNLQRCINDEACLYEKRSEKLEKFTTNFTDCNMSSVNVTVYENILCREGYKGPLCGSCNDSYGLAFGLQCSKCPHPIESISTILLVLLYLIIVSSFTIRGSLPSTSRNKNLKLLRFQKAKKYRSKPHIKEHSSESVEAERRTSIALEQLPSLARPSTSIAASLQELEQGNLLEITKWRTTEVFKIMLNFLQTTGIAVGINVGWTEQMMTMFEASEYVGLLTAAAISRPIDCLVAANSASVKAIWRTLIILFVPVAVVGLFATCWGLQRWTQGYDYTYFRNRVSLSAIAVVYISYLGLTKLAIRIFSCVQVNDDEDPFSEKKDWLWIADTAIQCYSADHLILVFIACSTLAVITLSFPVTLAIILYSNKTSHTQRESWTFETMDFLYRTFKAKYAFWECLIMLRKTLLSIIVVFAYNLGPQSQGLLACLVLLCFLYLHFVCCPYDERFSTLNYYESGSLLVSCMTLLLGQFFEKDRSSETIQSILAVVIILINIIFFAVLFLALLRSAVTHFKVILEANKKDTLQSESKFQTFTADVYVVLRSMFRVQS